MMGEIVDPLFGKVSEKTIREMDEYFSGGRSSREEAPMAVYGDSVDGETCPPSESVNIPPRELIPQPDDGPGAGLAAPFSQATQPNYIAQGRAGTREEKSEWWKARAVEAVAEGCTFSRASVYAGDESIILFEAWQVQPRNQGEPRWQFMHGAVSHSFDDHPIPTEPVERKAIEAAES